MEEENIQKARMLMLQILAETYLQMKDESSSPDSFTKKIDSLEVLTQDQLFALRSYLKESYERMGLDLETVVKNHQEEYLEEKLSQYEMNELIRRADEMIVFVGIFEKTR